MIETVSDLDATGRAYLKGRIAHLRDKLIDISKRNPLISFKHSGKSVSFLRVVDESPDVLFAKLRSGAMTFEPLPDSDEEPEDEKTAEFKMAIENARLTDDGYITAMAALGEGEHDEEKATELERKLRAKVREALGLPKLHTAGKLNIEAYARAHGFDPNYELPLQADAAGQHLNDDKIRVLYTRTSCDARLRKIRDRARSYEQEHGIPTLYVVFGFVEWCEDDASSAVHCAPLLLMRAYLEREHANGRQIYTLAGSDEDLAPNFALRELLRRDCAVEIPDVADEEEPCAYFSRIEAILAPIQRLRLRRFVTIAILKAPAMALWWDLHPDRWPQGTLLNHDKIALLLGARGAGEAADRAFPADYDIENEPFEAQAPALILPADVSQCSALIDAANGRSLAIQGPPGTGKSQTIANLIASAIDAGKRVLFCAEKSAALDVVAKRLVERRFGPLMLELHSDHAKKTDVMASLALRVEAAPSPVSSEVHRKRRELRQQRDTLRRYISLLRQPVGGLGRRVNALLWRMLRLNEELADALPSGLLEHEIAQPERLTPDDLSFARQVLDTVSGAAADIQQRHGTLRASPWHAAASLPAATYDQNRVLAALSRVVKATEDVVAFIRAVENELTIALPSTVRQVQQWLDACGRLPRLPPEMCSQRLRTALRAPEEMRRLCGKLASYRTLLDECKAVHPAPLSADLDKLRRLVAGLRAEGIDRTSRAALEERLAAAQGRASALGELDFRLRPLFYRLKLNPEALSILSLRALLVAFRKFASADPELWEFATVALLEPHASGVIRKAEDEAEVLCRRLEQHSARADVQLWRSHSAEALADYASILAASGLGIRLFAPRYKLARKVARAIAHDPSHDRLALAELLRELSEWQADVSTYTNNVHMTGLLGDAWRGPDTDFALVHRACNLLRQVDALLQPADVGHVLPLLLAEPGLRSEALALQAHADDTVRDVLTGLDVTVTVAEARASAAAEAERLAPLLAAAVSAGVTAQGTLSTHNQGTDTVFEYLQRLHDHLSASPEKSRLWAWYAGPAEDPGALERALQLAEAIAASDLPVAVKQILASAEDVPSLVATLVARGEEGRSLTNDQRHAWAAFRDLVEADTNAFLYVPDLDAAEWSAIAARARQALDDTAGLRIFAELLKYLADAEAAGVRFMFDVFAAAGKPMDRLSDSYELLVVINLLKSCLRDDGAHLLRVGGMSLNEARQRFRDLDERLYRLEAERIVAQSLDKRAPYGVDSGPIRSWTGFALIKREMSKQRRHLPIRQLIARAGEALQTLKPVWLMSPSAVAQHIEPEAVTFDLVIIDEASQMEPEFAIGAIARAAQLVVVGDPMQLPPTPFFKIGADDDEDEDEDYGGDAESILDLAFARFPDTRRLKWHYRSRHASLIAHSNREFYNSGLVVFPNSTMNDPLLGVKHVYVGGTYQNKMNEEEARAVIEAATGLMYTRPELSIGIVTMNASQRELIFRQFERAAADDAAVRAYMDRHEPTIERFFVKNLENVQGDERDVIIISTLYGPAPGTCAVLQRFGPINSATGHRRLNVLFTRAKMSTMVFTSLKPTDIVIGENSSGGVRALRKFLKYAAGGAVVDDASGGDPDSDFEVFVADRLRAAGYEAVPQVGVEGFRIDLGVRHSDYPNGFIAGIECDGATYHSGLTIRDRDRIRQDVLEGLGWRIYRVWSTDWFNDCERETDKLLRWLGEQREAASARARVEQVFTTPAPSLDPDEEPGQFAADEPADPDEDPVVVAEAEEAAPAAVNAADEPTRAESEAEYDPEAGEEARPDIPVVRPEGRKRTLDERIDYYELAPGYYEVWIDDHPVGKVTRLNVGLAPTDFRSRPQFRAEVYASGEMLNYEDIYVAVRAVARLAGARSPAPAAE